MTGRRLTRRISDGERIEGTWRHAEGDVEESTPRGVHGNLFAVGGDYGMSLASASRTLGVSKRFDSSLDRLCGEL
ncbi:hypothetical protein ACFT7S_33455 [Streptomyces sp. NPDC057136]|uniref:hypothetical protein n=1 Tax=Streptomyces sp. NPDC057136 TaxID=3346029 RepID=UPI00363DADB9